MDMTDITILKDTVKELEIDRVISSKESKYLITLMDRDIKARKRSRAWYESNREKSIQRSKERYQREKAKRQ